MTDVSTYKAFIICSIYIKIYCAIILNEYKSFEFNVRDPGYQHKQCHECIKSIELKLIHQKVPNNNNKLPIIPLIIFPFLFHSPFRAFRHKL